MTPQYNIGQYIQYERNHDHNTIGRIETKICNFIVIRTQFQIYIKVWIQAEKTVPYLWKAMKSHYTEV